MSDDSSSEDENENPANNFNYSNCIITQNDDSNCSSNFSNAYFDESSSSKSQKMSPEIVDVSDVEFTPSDVESLNLSPEELYFFILGLLRKMERYLSNISEETHKDWLKNKIKLMQNLVIQNVSFKQQPQPVKKFKLAIAKSKKTVSKKVKKITADNKKSKQINEPDQSEMEGHTEVEEPRDDTSDTHLNDVKVPLLNATNSKRRSMRLHEFAKDRELVNVDRLSYMIRKLPSIKLEPVSGDSIKTLVKKVQMSKSMLNKKTNAKKSELNKTSKGGQSSEKISVQNEKSNRKRAKSLGMDQKTTVQQRKSTVRKDSVKRKGKSLDGKDGQLNKKPKKNLESSETNISASTSSNGKRKLYSSDRWLDTFSTTQLESSPI